MTRTLRLWTALIVATVALAAPIRAGDEWDIAQLDAILATANSADDILPVGDMRFRYRVLKAFRNELAGIAASSAAAQTGVAIWPGGVVPFVFDAGVSASQQQAFLDATGMWATFANVQFVPRTTQIDYVLVKNVPGLSGGNSHVGRTGGAQPLNIGSTSWNSGTLTHELGHVLGLVHEHQRDNRDSYVNVLTANIAPGAEANFTKLPSSNNLGVYDFLSVMHYARDTLSKSPGVLDTLQPLAAYSAFIDEMGRQTDRVLSTRDRMGMASLYGAGPLLSPIVTKTDDTGPGSLRAALYQAIDQPGTTITFNIPTGDPNFDGSVFTIRPRNEMVRPGPGTAIDGSSQPGNTNPNGPEIVLSGAALAGQFVNGLRLTDANCTVRGLVINGFDVNGILIEGPGATGNVIEGCYIGTDAHGLNARPNEYSGIEISGGATGSRIGGATPASRNVLSGNSDRGVLIRDPDTSGNRVEGNYIGTDSAGARPLANGWRGVEMENGAAGNVIGAPGAGNLISGQGPGAYGVAILGAGTSGNIVQANRIGLDAAGAGALPNQIGVTLFLGASDNLIGGATPGAGNIISGNLERGIDLSQAGTSDNRVVGNIVGLAATGAAAVPNATGGIALFSGATSNIVGPGNVVSGNGGDGIAISSNGTTANIVRGNVVGLREDGSIAGNSGGIAIFGEASGNTIGGEQPGDANWVSGNAWYGIGVWPDSNANRVSRNSLHSNASSDLYVPAGANGNQPAPLLVAASLTTTTNVSGSLFGDAGTYRVELFVSPPGSFASGKTFLGAIDVTLTTSPAPFNAMLAPLAAHDDRITATVTSASGNTSRFSNALVLNTEPTDTDRDGLPDAYENATPGLSAANPADAALDSDGDGATNLQEFRAGTNPFDATSRLIAGGATGAGGDFVLTFSTVAGRTYRVERGASPGGAWTPLAVNIAGTGGVIQITDPGALMAAARFYRVLVP